jgi:hypothetical protein
VEHENKTAPKHDPRHETALEEIVRETRATSRRSWAVTGVIAATLLTIMYVVTVHRADKEAVQHSVSNSVTQSQQDGT